MLHVAAQGDSPASAVYFINKGFDPDTIDKLGMTPLHHAGHYGCELSVIYLVQYKASIDLRDAKGQTPLHTSISRFADHKNPECMKRLLLQGADRDAVDKEGKTMLDLLKQVQ